MQTIASYFIRIGDATSQLLNVLIFLGENPNESISGRSWRLRQNWFWGKMRVLVDWLFSSVQASHCEKAHTNDVARAARLIRNQGL